MCLQNFNPEAVYDGVLKPDSIATTIISNLIGFIASSLALLVIAPLYQVSKLSVKCSEASQNLILYC